MSTKRIIVRFVLWNWTLLYTLDGISMRGTSRLSIQSLEEKSGINRTLIIFSSFQLRIVEYVRAKWTTGQKNFSIVIRIVKRYFPSEHNFNSERVHQLFELLARMLQSKDPEIYERVMGAMEKYTKKALISIDKNVNF